MAEETGTTGEKTFTQADLDRVVRERLAREREKYADYDDLKTKAGEADKSKGQLDKLLEKVSGLEERATKAEATALRADVAQAKGLTATQAKRLHGSTKAELEADADELLSMFKPADKDGDGKGEKTEGEGEGKGDGSTEPAKAPTGGRPKEKLTSGAVPSTSDDQNPADMAKAILSSDF